MTSLNPRRWHAGVWALSAQWLSVLVTAAISLALSVWLARRMEPSGFGRYAYLLNLATLLALAQDAGLRTLVLREQVSPSPALKSFEAVLPGLARGHLLVTTLLLVGGCLALIPFGADLALPAAVWCFAAVSLSQLVSVQLKAAGQWQREGRWQAGARMSSALAIIFGVLLFGPEPGIVFGAWGIGLMLAYAVLGQDVRDRTRWPPPAPLYHAAAGFLWIDLATCLYRRSDIVILQRMADPAEIGQYAAAYRLFDGVLLLAMPLALFFFRRLRKTRDHAAAARRLLRRSLFAAGAAGLGLALGGAWLGPWLIEFLFGPAYQSAGSLLRWPFAAFVFVLPNYVLTQAAIALDRARCYAWGAGLAAVTNLALNLLLVPQHGARGAATAVIATEAMLCAALCIGLFGRHKPEQPRIPLR